MQAIDSNSKFGNFTFPTVDELFCNGVTYLPQRCENLYTFSAVHNLEAQTMYRFIVVALNDVSREYYPEFYTFMTNMRSVIYNNSMTSNIDVLNKQVQ